MPIYEFECEFGHRFEKIKTIAESDDKERCEECEFLYSNEDEGYVIVWAERIPSQFNTTQLAKPTIIFENKITGDRRIAASENEQIPSGYEKRELKGSIERSKFENQETKRLNSIESNKAEFLEWRDKETIKNRRQEVDANINRIANDSQEKEFMKKAREYRDKKRDKKRKYKKEQNVILHVNNFDRSNIGK